MYKVISFGHRCSSASFFKLLDIKTESYPFDWLVSKLDIIKECIETKFVNFLNVDNYNEKISETFNMIDDKKIHIRNQKSQVNMFYETDINNKQTYNYKLALIHYNLKNDFEYYERCVNRLYELFKSDIKKYYLYIHPIMGFNDFQTNKDNILNEFNSFSEYIIEKTKNIFGVYFIMVMHNDNNKSLKLIETPNHVVFIVYCNEDFKDAGLPFLGNNNIETKEILSILKQILV